MKQTLSNRIFRYAARYLGGILLYAGACLTCDQGQGFVAMILFFVLGGLEAELAYSETRKLLDLRILLSVSWTLGLGLTSLKLTKFSALFDPRTWLISGGFLFSFLLAYDLLALLIPAFRKGRAPEKERVRYRVSAKRLFIATVVLTALSFAGLLAEAIRFNFLFPIFEKGAPHAYTWFHITGVHYFVVSAVFIPALTVLYFRELNARGEKITTVKLVFFILANLYAIAVPVLLLTKQMLAFTVFLPLLVFFLISEKTSRKKKLALFLGLGVAAALVFVLLVSKRSYPEGYLASVFQFKDERVPVAFQYPYVYVTSNFENLNLLVAANEAPTYGLRELVPLGSLTGLKFIPAIGIKFWFPPHYVLPELGTTTVIYDAYGDFHSAGVIVFGMLLGVASYLLMKRFEVRKSVFCTLLYAEVALYFLLAFFATWFSNPTTWFWFALTLAIGLFSREKEVSNDQR